MKKMGRPVIDDVPRDSVVTFRMSTQDHEKLKEYAKNHQMTITETLKEGVELLYKTQK